MLMEHCEDRMEHEIKRMKSCEKSVEGLVLVSSSVYDEEKYINDEIEQMKRYEEHMNYEIQRMKHYERRLKSEIRLINSKLESIECRSLVEHHGEVDDSETEQNKCGEKLEELRKELVRREPKLEELSNEIEKRQIKFKEHENELEMLREKIQRQEEHVEHEKQIRTEAIERSQYAERKLAKFRIGHMKERAAELLEYFNKLQRGEIKIGNDNKISMKCRAQHYQLHEQQSIEGAISHNQDQHTMNQYEQYDLPLFKSREEVDFEEQLYRITDEIQYSYTIDETASIIELPKYDILINYAGEASCITEQIKTALPRWYSTHIKDNSYPKNIKICLDNTSTVVITIINRLYELDTTCQVDMIHTFKRQFPLVFVVPNHKFKPSTKWLNLIWNASTTKKIFLHSPHFEENLRSALSDAQWNLSTNTNISEMTHSSAEERSNRFLGDHHEWTIAYNNPAQVSDNYRQFIIDPLRINTDTKLQDFYYNYIRSRFKDSYVISLFKTGATENNVRNFIKAYTQSGLFSITLNHQLAANVLFYFESTLDDAVDYQLVKCLIDFVALCIYRQELQSYSFVGTVYRGIVMSEEDLVKYVVGSRIMNTSFLSTSKDKQVAEFFSGKGQQKFAIICTYVIHNKNNRRTALDISTLSCFPHEREVLILPFSAFHVESVTRSSDYSKPIEMTFVEDEYDILQNIDTI